jgi:hypothetical protein
MTSNKNRMWIVETRFGFTKIGRDPKKDPKASKEAIKGRLWFSASRSLGYVPIFTNRKEAQKFARRIKSKIPDRQPSLIEVEFYKGEMEAD